MPDYAELLTIVEDNNLADGTLLKCDCGREYTLNWRDAWYLDHLVQA